MKKILLTLGIGGTIIFGATTLVSDEAVDTIPAFELTIDEADSNPQKIREQMELITAGGFYKDREIKVTITKRTHPDNREILKEFNVKIQKEVQSLSKVDEDKKLDNVKNK